MNVEHPKIGSSLEDEIYQEDPFPEDEFHEERPDIEFDREDEFNEEHPMGNFAPEDEFYWRHPRRDLAPEDEFYGRHPRRDFEREDEFYGNHPRRDRFEEDHSSDNAENPQENQENNTATDMGGKNSYTILAIFESLTIEELLKIGELNAALNDIVTRHFLMRKFGLHERTVLIGERIQPLYNATNKIENWENAIAVIDPYLALKFLRKYGHVITHVEIVQPEITSIKLWNLILQSYVNEQCSETLKELTFQAHFDTVEWRKPYEQLETLHVLKGWLEYVNHTRTNLTGKFPSLRNLELELEKESVIELFEQHFPNLESFTFRLNPENENSTVHLYEKIMDLNPQIQNVVINGAKSFRNLQWVIEKLQNLKTLTFSLKNVDGMPKQWDSVTAIDSIKSLMAGNLNLKEIVMNALDEEPSGFVNTIKVTRSHEM